MSAETVSRTKPEVANLDKWISLADAMIMKGLGQNVWSGMTLMDWQAVLCGNEQRFIGKSFAVAAVRGIVAEYLRGELGSCADGMTIALDFDAANAVE